MRGRVEHEGPESVPVRLDRFHVFRRGRLPGAGLVGKRIAGQGARFCIAVLACPSQDVVGHGLPVGDGACGDGRRYVKGFELHQHPLHVGAEQVFGKHEAFCDLREGMQAGRQAVEVGRRGGGR